MKHRLNWDKEESVGALDMDKEITEISEVLAPKVAKRKLEHERCLKSKENASDRESKRWKKELPTKSSLAEAGAERVSDAVVRGTEAHSVSFP